MSRLPLMGDRVGNDLCVIPQAEQHIGCSLWGDHDVYMCGVDG